MYLKELSMYLYNKKILFSIISLLFIFLSSCASSVFYNKEIANKIFINDMSERRGLIIRNTLLEYFPNRNYSETDYIINVETIKNEDYYLTDRSGFASRNRIIIQVNWTVTYKPTNKVVLKISNTYSESYNIDRSGQANFINEKSLEDSISRTIARDIALKIFSLMLKIEKNPSIIMDK